MKVKASPHLWLSVWGLCALVINPCSSYPKIKFDSQPSTKLIGNATRDIKKPFLFFSLDQDSFDEVLFLGQDFCNFDVFLAIWSLRLALGIKSLIVQTLKSNWNPTWEPEKEFYIFTLTVLRAPIFSFFYV